jgi:hypothetical protein
MRINLFAFVLASILGGSQLLPTPASAAEAAVDLGCCTKHFRSGDYNEVNPGIGFEYGGFGRFLTAGVMRDSDSKASPYAGGGVRLSVHRFLHVGGFLGVLHRSDSGTIPAVAPTLTLGTNKVSANLVYIPAIDGAKGGKNTVQVLYLQFRISTNAFSL